MLRRAVGLAIVCRPIGGGSTNGSCLEAICVADDPGRQKASVAPAHDAEPPRIGDALTDEIIHPGHHVIEIAKALRLDILQAETRRRNSLNRENWAPKPRSLF